jgi:hypothetical protein
MAWSGMLVTQRLEILPLLQEGKLIHAEQSASRETLAPQTEVFAE